MDQIEFEIMRTRIRIDQLKYEIKLLKETILYLETEFPELCGKKTNPAVDLQAGNDIHHWWHRLISKLIKKTS